MTLSIIIPVLNEARSLADVLPRLAAAATGDVLRWCYWRGASPEQLAREYR